MNASILPLCLDGTRQDVLQEIWDWVADNKSKKNILWLHGFAGSGKTTVAATVSRLKGVHFSSSKEAGPDRTPSYTQWLHNLHILLVSSA